MIIFATEGDDAQLAFLAGELADAVAMEAGAVDNPFGGEIAGGGFDGPIAALMKTGGAPPVFMRAAIGPSKPPPAISPPNGLSTAPASIATASASSPAKNASCASSPSVANIINSSPSHGTS